MSAFVVSPATIHRCVCGMLPAGFACETADDLGRRLLAMNNQAVISRYGREDDPMLCDPDEYSFSPIFPPRMQILKALHCLKYQCTEGEVPKLALYDEVDRKIRSIESEIVCEMPEYSAIPWDF